jgi:hypothetical protein
MAVSPHWYYSGGATNADPNLSIGGAKSSIVLSSTQLECLFDTTKGAEASAGADEYRLLYCQNDGVTSWVDPKMYITAQPNVAAEPTGETLDFAMADEGKNAEVTAIADVNTAPATVTFDDPATLATGTALPSAPYAEADYVGVWFHRHTPASQAIKVGSVCSWEVTGDNA